MLRMKHTAQLAHKAMHNTLSSSDRDRRGAPRSKSTLAAYLITPSGNQVRGVARNLSRSGTFLETAPSGTWQVGETARLVFMLSEGNVVRLARYAVLVVRETKHGVGLAFWRAARPVFQRPSR